MPEETAPRPRFTPRPQRSTLALENVQRVLVVMSGKGGVGKSTVALNVAAALKQQGQRVGFLDLDITNPNAPTMTGLGDHRFTPEGGLAPPEMAGIPVASTAFFTPSDSAMVWRGPMKQKMIVQLLSRVAWPELDVLVVDLPPGTSDEPLTVAELLPEKAAALLVTTPQRVSTEDTVRSHTFTKKVNMRVLGVVENMSGFTCDCGQTHDLFGKGGGEAMAKQLGVRFLGAVPLDPRLVEAGDTGKPLVLTDPEAAPSKAFADVAKELVSEWSSSPEA